MQSIYNSPSSSRLVAGLENNLLAADSSCWTGRQPLCGRVVADVPCALYLNFLARKSYAALVAPDLFRPFDLPGSRDETLFTVLFFTLARARPLWAPRICSVFSPPVMQSNWRFYGDIT